MLSRIFGNSGKASDSPSKESQATRGVEHIEGDPDKAWREWNHAQAAQAAGLLPSLEFAAPEPEAPRMAFPTAGPPEGTVDFELATEPMPLQSLGPEQRKDNALATVERYHHRIANTIRTLWGYKECGVYINKLIMAGGDGMGHARVGFNQDAVQAMLELSDLHDAAFGPPDSLAGGLGLSI